MTKEADGECIMFQEFRESSWGKCSYLVNVIFTSFLGTELWFYLKDQNNQIKRNRKVNKKLHFPAWLRGTGHLAEFWQVEAEQMVKWPMSRFFFSNTGVISSSMLLPPSSPTCNVAVLLEVKQPSCHHEVSRGGKLWAVSGSIGGHKKSLGGWGYFGASVLALYCLPLDFFTW